MIPVMSTHIGANFWKHIPKPGQSQKIGHTPIDVIYFHTKPGGAALLRLTNIGSYESTALYWSQTKSNLRERQYTCTRDMLGRIEYNITGPIEEF